MSSSESDDDYCKYGNAQCLPIDPFDIKNVDLLKCPTTAQEHMQYVVAERRRMKKILRVEPVDEPMLDSSANDDITDGEQNAIGSNETGQENMEVTVEWYHSELSEFSDTRDTVAALRQMLGRDFKNQIIRSDESQCFEYCFGQNSPTEGKPLLKNLALLNDESLIILLGYMERWLLNGSIRMTVIGEWIYKILACLSFPVATTTLELLKRIIDTCKDIQSKMNMSDQQSENEAAALNQITCVIVKYFIQ